MDDPLVGTFTEIPFPPWRTIVSDTVRIGMKQHRIPILVEVDVTPARAAIEKRHAEKGESLSFTGWVIACLAKAANEQPRVHAVRQGRHKIVLFQDVDVGIMIHRQIEGRDPPEYVLQPYLIRKANEKSVETIHAEIRAAQAMKMGAGGDTVQRNRGLPSPRLMKLFASLPFFLRKAVYWNRTLRGAFRVKRAWGTVAVTSVGMYGKVGTGSNWGLPITFQPLVVALGAIARKPALVGERIEPREFLGMTVVFDHDVVDGAPMAMFLQRVRDLMESGYGLPVAGGA